MSGYSSHEGNYCYLPQKSTLYVTIVTCGIGAKIWQAYRMKDTEAFATALAKTLHTLRTDQGLSMEELAVKAGITRPAISMYESGDRNPSVHVLYSISKALGMKTSMLIAMVEVAEKES